MAGQGIRGRTGSPARVYQDCLISRPKRSGHLLDCRGRLAWSRRENVDRFLDGVDRALGGARAMRDQIVGAVEIGPADFADAGGDQQITPIPAPPPAARAPL